MTSAWFRCVACGLVALVIGAVSAQAVAASEAEAVPPSAATEAVVPPWSSESTFLGPPVLLPSADPTSEEFVGPPQMPNFRILDQEVLPGARARLEAVLNRPA